jgi:hypothetical protein
MPPGTGQEQMLITISPASPGNRRGQRLPGKSAPSNEVIASVEIELHAKSKPSGETECTMENQNLSQQEYENQLVFHLVIFLKAMQQYSIWGKRAAASDVLRTDPQFETGMRQILKAIDLCGQRFLALPEPPQNGIEADRVIRGMGREVGQFAESLENLLVTEDPLKRDQFVTVLAEKSRAIKQEYRQFAELYDQAYPGRLSMALNTLQGSGAAEPQI